MTYAYVDTSDVRALRSSHRYDVNPTHDPNTIRYASAISEARENCDGSTSASSPVIAPPAINAAPPIIISIAAATNGRWGSTA